MVNNNKLKKRKSKLSTIVKLYYKIDTRGNLRKKRRGDKNGRYKHGDY